MAEEPKLHVRHIRSSRMCMSSARAWFADHGWNWSDFVANGRRLEDFRETGCPLAGRAVAEADKEIAEGNSGG